MEDLEAWPLHDGDRQQQARSLVNHQAYCEAIKRYRPDVKLTSFSLFPNGRERNLRGWWNYEADRYVSQLDNLEPLALELDFVTVPVYWFTKSLWASSNYAESVLRLAQRYRFWGKPIYAMVCPRIANPEVKGWQRGPEISLSSQTRFKSLLEPLVDGFIFWDSSASEKPSQPVRELWGLQ